MTKKQTKPSAKVSSSKAKTAKSVKVIKKLRSSLPEIEIKSSSPVTSKINTALLVKALLVVAIGIVVFLLIQKNRGLFIAGTVNKTIISRLELNQRMAEKYADATFEELVSEKLLEDNLKKAKIVISNDEVKAELEKIKANYGGEEQFKSAIAQFGMTEEKAIASIKQSIGLRKLIESQGAIEISDKSIEEYFNANKALFGTKKLDEVKADIKETLTQQEIYTRSQKWYQETRDSASVNSYL